MTAGVYSVSRIPIADGYGRDVARSRRPQLPTLRVIEPAKLHSPPAMIAIAVATVGTVLEFTHHLRMPCTLHSRDRQR
jgi:hypothetical protein